MALHSRAGPRTTIPHGSPAFDGPSQDLLLLRHMCPFDPPTRVPESQQAGSLRLAGGSERSVWPLRRRTGWSNHHVASGQRPGSGGPIIPLQGLPLSAVHSANSHWPLAGKSQNGDGTHTSQLRPCPGGLFLERERGLCPPGDACYG